MSDLDLPKHMSCERYDRLEREAELDEQARRIEFEATLEMALETIELDDFENDAEWQAVLHEKEQELRQQWGYEKGGK